MASGACASCPTDAAAGAVLHRRRPDGLQQRVPEALAARGWPRLRVTPVTSVTFPTGRDPDTGVTPPRVHLWGNGIRWTHGEGRPVDLRLAPGSRVDLNGDVSWRFACEEDGRAPVERRGGVRLQARHRVITAASRYLEGDMTAGMMAYAAGAVRLQPEASESWVTGSNLEEIDHLVQRFRRELRPVFQSGTYEEVMQFGAPYGHVGGTVRERRGGTCQAP